MQKPIKENTPVLSASLNAEEFASLMEQVGPFESNPEIAVAVSGGADSLALVFLCQRWAKEFGAKIIALTVDHGLRTEAKEEAEKVKSWLQDAGIEHHTLTYEGDKPGSNIQDEARNIRYNLLNKWCKDNNILHLLTAHHMEDQVETFLLRLNRGSGIDGLAAMASISLLDNVRLLRPLLNTERSKLRGFLEEINQEWIEDPTNENTDFSRNNLRKILQFNANEVLTKRLYNTAENMARARIALESETANHMISCVTAHEEGYCTVNSSYLLELPEEFSLRILASILTTISGDIYHPRFEKLTRLLDVIREETPLKGKTLWGCKIFSVGKDLIICRELSQIEENKEINPGKSITWDNRFNIKLSVKSDNFVVGALNQSGYQQILDKIGDISLPKQVIWSLPTLKSFSNEGLEKVLSVPHIDFYDTSIPKNGFSCTFQPRKALAEQSFGC